MRVHWRDKIWITFKYNYVPITRLAAHTHTHTHIHAHAQTHFFFFIMIFAKCVLDSFLYIYRPIKNTYVKWGSSSCPQISVILNRYLLKLYQIVVRILWNKLDTQYTLLVSSIDYWVPPSHVYFINTPFLRPFLEKFTIFLFFCMRPKLGQRHYCPLKFSPL